MKKVAVIGSGLAAISSIEILIKKGIKPVVLDVGDTLPSNLQNIVQGMGEVLPEYWSKLDLDKISFNGSIEGASSLPRKFSYGSDFFYGKEESIYNYKNQLNNPSPPFSHAQGGFANGWGGAVLPVDDCDLGAWPIARKELEKYYEEVLSNIPFSAQEDELSKHFPLYKEHCSPLRLSKGNIQFLEDCKKKKEKLNKFEILVGQSRLLTSASEVSEGCKYCGYCMSGCVYHYIFKPNLRLKELIKQNLIEYRPGIIVERLKEENGQVVIFFKNSKNEYDTQVFHRVFLGAGAINSAHIVLKSKNIFNQRIPVLSTGGFIVPIFSIKKNYLQWPNVNTQPGIFLEFKVPKLSNHWVHTQLSTPNELVLEKLGLLNQNISLKRKIKHLIANHLYIAQCNLHSNHGVGHHIWLENNGFLSFQYNDVKHSKIAINKALFEIFKILKSIGYYALIPFVQTGIGSQGFHLGGSLPMKHHPHEEMDTNILGCPKGWSKIHVIDSSNFPSIPGTTIGLTVMANAARIAHEALNLEENI